MRHPSRDRLGENAAALVASSVITAALGLVFWVVAARLLPTADVGTGTAVVTSIVLLGNLSTLGLRNGLIRFIAPAGRDCGRFILISYLVCAGVALFLASAFALGTPLWADELAGLRDDPRAGLAFALGASAWTVFVLQDNVLTGLRRAVWVPIENLGYSVLKLGLLAALATTGAWALPLAWCLPALALIVPVNVLVFRRLVPEHHELTPDRRVFTRSSIARFTVGDYAADVIRMLGVEVVVLVVLATRGAEETAYAFFAITIAATGQLVSSNIVTAFVAEASARPVEADSLARRSAVHIGRLIVPGAVVGALLAPVVLQVFGSEYADNGSTLLRLLIIDSIPLAVAALATGWARLERAVWMVVLIALGIAAAPLFGVVVLAPTFGLDAIGWSALVGHSLLAAVLLATTLRPVFAGMQGRLVRWLVHQRDRTRQRRRAQLVAAVLDDLDAVRADGASATPRRAFASDNDTAVVRLERSGAPRIVKIATSVDAAEGLGRHVSALQALADAAREADAPGHAGGAVHQDADERPVASLLPSVVATGDRAGYRYVVETACEGTTPRVADRATIQLVAAGVAAVHDLTSATTTGDTALLDQLVTEPISVLAADRRITARHGELDILAGLVVDAIAGRRFVTARTHGDCWIGNALVDQDESGSARLSGLVDWEDSRARGLPDVDFAHLWLASQGAQIGRTTVAALSGDPEPDPFGELAVATPNPQLPIEIVVLLAWLDHVAAGLRRGSRFRLGRVWLANNVQPVLRVVPTIDSVGRRRSDAQLDLGMEAFDESAHAIAPADVGRAD